MVNECISQKFGSIMYGGLVVIWKMLGIKFETNIYGKNVFYVIV